VEAGVSQAKAPEKAMKKYYLSKIKRVTENGMTFWRHGIQAYPNVEYQGGEIKVDPVTGIPTEKALLVLVGGINHVRFNNDADLVAMPDVSKDTKVSAIHTTTKLDAKAKIKSIGFDDVQTEAAWGNADGMRDILNHYGQKNNPGFDCNNFDLDES
jgi:hypothetical protein